MMVGCLHSSWLIQRSLWKIWTSLNVVQAVSSLMVQMHRLRFFLSFVFASRVMLHSKEFIAWNWFVTYISGSNLSSHIFQRRMRPCWRLMIWWIKTLFYRTFRLIHDFLHCFQICVVFQNFSATAIKRLPQFRPMSWEEADVAKCPQRCRGFSQSLQNSRNSEKSHVKIAVSWRISKKVDVLATHCCKTVQKYVHTSIFCVNGDTLELEGG